MQFGATPLKGGAPTDGVRASGAVHKWTGFQRAEPGRKPAAHPSPSNKLELFVMPKMKTKKSAAKRFVVRPGGTVKRGQAFKRHILTKKTTKNKRHLRGSTAVHDSDLNSVRAMLPFA
jgi:large subunit ribosomal protein L35